MPLSIRRVKDQISMLQDALEVGETWDCSDMERAFNYRRHWQRRTLLAPRSMRSKMMGIGQEIEARSPTFRRLPGAARTSAHA